MKTCDRPTLRRYQDGCRCDGCKDVSRKARTQQRLRALERSRTGAVYPQDLVATDESRKRIFHAHDDRGLSFNEISRITGVNANTIERIYYTVDPNKKTTRRVHIQIARGLEEDDVRSLVPQQLVDSNKTRQVIRSLSAQGWSREHVAAIVRNNLHVSGDAIIRISGNNRVTKQTHDRALWLERILGAAVGPSSSSRVRAVKRGWFPLKHYDANGDIIVSSLSPEQKRQRLAAIEREEARTARVH